MYFCRGDVIDELEVLDLQDLWEEEDEDEELELISQYLNKSRISRQRLPKFRIGKELSE